MSRYVNLPASSWRIVESVIQRCVIVDILRVSIPNGEHDEGSFLLYLSSTLFVKHQSHLSFIAAATAATAAIGVY